jgi:phosphate:Na+ symporter
MVGIVLIVAGYAASRAIWGPISKLVPTSSIDAGHQAALMVVAFNAVTPLALTLAMPAFYRLCLRLAPPREDEELARPQFLHEEVGDNAAVTLVLAEREQLRLLRRLPQYCDWLRENTPPDAASVERYSDAFFQVGQYIEQAQSGLMALSMTAEDTEWLINQQKRQHMLSALHEACHELYLASREAGPEILPLRSTVVETLDTFLLTVIEGMALQDKEELEIAERMTAGQGAAMERVRKKYLSLADTMTDTDRIRILQLTSVFEHAAWSLRNFAQLLNAALDGVGGNEARREHELSIARAAA